MFKKTNVEEFMKENGLYSKSENDYIKKEYTSIITSFFEARDFAYFNILFLQSMQYFTCSKHSSTEQREQFFTEAFELYDFLDFYYITHYAEAYNLT